jgi:hypothetical protein
MPISNIPSVLELGILSYERAGELDHASVALAEVQERREKQVPGGYKLHQYANLYFHSRNPMLYKRRGENICILRINRSIIKIEGIVFTDRNAASDYVKFLGTRDINQLNFEMIYSRDWRDENKYIKWEKKSVKCAEVLVPGCVPAEYIFGAYVKSEEDKNTLQRIWADGIIEVNKEMYFL